MSSFVGAIAIADLVKTTLGPKGMIPQFVKGNMQLFSVDQQRSQALKAHAASFASLKVLGNENPSILISFATKSSNAGRVTLKLHVIELGQDVDVEDELDEDLGDDNEDGDL